MTNAFNTKFVCAALAAACTFATVSAPAQASVIEFAYAQSELASEISRQALADRVQRTARRACGDLSVLLPLDAHRHCREAVEAELIAKIGDTRLAAPAAHGRPASR